MEEHHYGDPDAHTPFLEAPIVSPSTWIELDRARKALGERGLWDAKLEARYGSLRAEARGLDDLANAARASLLGSWPGTLLLEAALGAAASPSHGAERQGHDSGGHGGDGQAHGPLKPAGRDQPCRHAFRIGPAVDVLLGAARLGGADPQARQELAERALPILTGPIAAIADLLAAFVAAADPGAAALGVRRVLAGPAGSGALAARVFCQPESGARHHDWLAWCAGIAAARNAIARGEDPVSVAVEASAVPQLDHGIVSVEPAEVREPDLGGAPVHVAVEGRFPARRPKGLEARIAGRAVRIAGWSAARIRLEVPRGCPSGPVELVRELSKKDAEEVREAGVRLARAAGGLSGSLFQRLDWTALAPVPSGLRRHECILRVLLGPRLRRFEVTDGQGRLIAGTRDFQPRNGNMPPSGRKLRPLLEGERIRIAWRVLAMDHPDPAPSSMWDRGRRLPLTGETDLAVPAGGLDLGLDIPGIGPMLLKLPTLLTLRGPREICLKPGQRTRVTFSFEPQEHDVTLQPDGSASPGSRVTVSPSGILVPAGEPGVAAFDLTATARPRGAIPAGVCAAHLDETGLGPLWPDDPAADSFDLVLRARRRDGVVVEHRLRVNVELPGGRWIRGGCLGIVGIHAALLPDGRVLFFGYDEDDRNRLGHGFAQTWTAEDGPGPLTVLAYNPFCAGHALRADGSLAIAGGHAHDQGGLDTTLYAIAGFFSGGFISGFFAGLFAPQGVGHGDSKKVHVVRTAAGAEPSWEELPEMDGARWYPTCVTLADGEVVILGGSAPFLANAWHRVNDDHERIDAAGNLVLAFDNLPEGEDFRPGDRRQLPSSGEGRVATLYNLAHLLPSEDATHPGHLFLVTDALARVYDPQANSLVGPTIDLGGVFTWWTQTSSVLLPIDVDHEGAPFGPIRILVPGGGTTGRGGGEGAMDPALGTMKVVEFDLPTRTLRTVSESPLTRPRILGDSILLPDGSVLLVNGAAVGFANDNRERVTRPDLITVAGDVAIARPLEDGIIERGYHSTAILLPDARVAVAGSTGGYSGMDNLVTEDFRVQIFEPPYMACGSRPVLLAAPEFIRYGERFRVEADDFALRPHVVLIRCSSTTHSLNTDQRLLRLWVEDSEPPRQRAFLDVTMVGNPTFAPPGFYLLFVLTFDGVPSIGRFVRVGS